MRPVAFSRSSRSSCSTRPHRLRVRRERAAARFVLYGVVGFALVQWLYFVAIERLPIGIGLLLEFTAPVLVALWARFAWHEPVRRRVWAALALVLAGLALVAQVWQGFASTPSALPRVSLAAGGARRRTTSWASTRPSRRDPLSLVCLALGFAAGFWAIVLPWWSFPFDALAESVALEAPFEAHAPVWALASGGSSSERSSRSRSPSGLSGTSPRRASRSWRCSRWCSRSIVAWVWLGETLSRPRCSAASSCSSASCWPRRRADVRFTSWHGRTCPPRRAPAATARASSARSRRSRRRSSITARPSTSASRSSTTSTSCAISRRAGRSSSRTSARSPPGRPSSTPRTASRRRCTPTRRELRHDVIDATCPLVTKVHVQARRYAAAGYTVILIGHAGHEEVVGTMGEAPEATILVQDVGEAEALELPRRRPSPTSRRRRSRSTRQRRSSARCGGGFPRSSGRRRRTSATRRPTGSGP